MLQKSHKSKNILLIIINKILLKLVKESRFFVKNVCERTTKVI